MLYKTNNNITKLSLNHNQNKLSKTPNQVVSNSNKPKTPQTNHTNHNKTTKQCKPTQQPKTNHNINQTNPTIN